MSDGALLPAAPPASAFAPHDMTGTPIPGLITVAGDRAALRFLEFFAAQIRNPQTRRAYGRAVADFCQWCEEAGVRRRYWSQKWRAPCSTASTSPRRSGCATGR